MLCSSSLATRDVPPERKGEHLLFVSGLLVLQETLELRLCCSLAGESIGVLL